MTTADSAARHDCGYFIAQHGRRLPGGLWEHSCEEITAIDASIRRYGRTRRERLARLVPHRWRQT